SEPTGPAARRVWGSWPHDRKQAGTPLLTVRRKAGWRRSCAICGEAPAQRFQRRRPARRPDGTPEWHRRRALAAVETSKAHTALLSLAAGPPPPTSFAGEPMGRSANAANPPVRRDHPRAA